MIPDPRTWPAWLFAPPTGDTGARTPDDNESELREARAYWRRAREVWRQQHAPNLNRVDFERVLRSVTSLREAS